MKTKFFLFLLLVAATQLKANNMLVKNVTTTGNNATNKTIQVQFDMSWDNSWRDAINWDAAWVFMKFKDANGLWQHVQLNTTGFANGAGTANTIQVASDKVGAFVYRSAAGTGTFSSTTMQLQWNYGLSGLTSVTGLEVRVFAVEMVYVPEGEFNVAKVFYNNPSQPNAARSFIAPGGNLPVINTRMTPTISYNDGNSLNLRIKGDIGVDFNNDGIIDNVTYPTGFKAFFCQKHETTEQSYCDFLNTLNPTQLSNIGIAGSSIFLSNGQYFSSNPDRACGNSTQNRTLILADWLGLRPMTILEFNKASYGPLQPFYVSNDKLLIDGSYLDGYPAWGSATGGYNAAPNLTNNVTGAQLKNAGFYATGSTSRVAAGASYYGILDLTGNAHEPVVRMTSSNYSGAVGNGVITSNGSGDINNLNFTDVMFVDMLKNGNSGYGGNGANIGPTNSGENFRIDKYGFRYVRSAE
jgi:hypothetical protein